jgi:hypothetical protein
MGRARVLRFCIYIYVFFALYVEHTLGLGWESIGRRDKAFMNREVSLSVQMIFDDYTTFPTRDQLLTATDFSNVVEEHRLTMLSDRTYILVVDDIYSLLKTIRLVSGRSFGSHDSSEPVNDYYSESACRWQNIIRACARLKFDIEV